MRLRLRPTTDGDETTLLRIYRDTREDELALTRWDETQRAGFVRMQFDAQRTHYRRYFPQSIQSLVEVDNGGGWQAAGRVWRDNRPHSIHLLDIALLGLWRGRGIGGNLLRQMMAEARDSGRSVTIYVEQGNPARRLYERLGFRPDGEPEGVHQKMAWRADTPVLMESGDEQA